MEHGVAIDQMRLAGTSLGTKVQGADVVADNTITGSILQHHLETLSNLLMYHSEAAVRLSTLELMGTLLNHGMIHPLDVIGLFIALQGDPEYLVRQTALSLLVIEDEKHSSFFDNRLLDGIELSVAMQSKQLGMIYPYVQASEPDGMLVAANDTSKRSLQSIYSQLYKGLIRGNRKRRSDFICGLMRRAEIHYQQVAAIRKQLEQLAITGQTAMGVTLASIVHSEQMQKLGSSGGVSDNNAVDIRIASVDNPPEDVVSTRMSKSPKGLHKSPSLSGPVSGGTSFSEEDTMKRSHSTGSAGIVNDTLNASLSSNGGKKRAQPGSIPKMAAVLASPIQQSPDSKDKTVAHDTTLNGSGGANHSSQMAMGSETSIQAPQSQHSKSRNRKAQAAKQAAAGINKEPFNYRDNIQTAVTHLETITYLSQTVASLPFDVQEEPLICIYWISRNIPVSSGIFHQHTQRILREIIGDVVGDGDAFLATSSGKFSSNGTAAPQEDDLIMNDDKFHTFMQTRMAHLHDSSSGCRNGVDYACVDDVLLSVITIESRCREVLMRLKSFLKSAYALSDERCLAFTPHDDSGATQHSGVGMSTSAAKTSMIADRDKQRHMDSVYTAIPLSADNFTSLTSPVMSLKDLINKWTSPLEKTKSVMLTPLDDVSVNRLVEICISDYNRLNSSLREDGDDYQHVSKVKRRNTGPRKSSSRHPAGKISNGRSRGPSKRSGSSVESGSDVGSDWESGSEDGLTSDTETASTAEKGTPSKRTRQNTSSPTSTLTSSHDGSKRKSTTAMRMARKRAHVPFVSLSAIPEGQYRTSSRKKRRTNRLVDAGKLSEGEGEQEDWHGDDDDMEDLKLSSGSEYDGNG